MAASTWRQATVALLGAFPMLAVVSCSRDAPSLEQPADPRPQLDRDAALEELGLTREALDRLEAAAGSSLEPLTDWDGQTVAVQAIVPEGQIESIRKSLSAELEPLGFIVFQSEMGFGMGPDKVGVVRGRDQYDILRAVQTDGVNHDITNEDVIAKLSEWEQQCEFEITGAGGDWVEARFVRMPRSMDAFAAEVYEFCPDVVDQGAGDVHALAVEMAMRNTLYLWWD